jgi:hypothetical protein
LWLGLTSGQRCVLIAVIEMACWKPSRFWSRTARVEIEVPRGSFVATQETIASRAGVTRKVARGALEQLEAAGFLNRQIIGPQRGHGVTLLTIVNYDRYQGADEVVGQRSGHQRDSKGVTKGVTKGALLEQGEQGEQGEPSNQTIPLPLAASNPLSEATKTADHLRQLFLDHDLDVPGIRKDTAYARRRLEWAKAFKALEGEDDGWPQEIQRELMTWAIADAQPFTVAGEVWTWGDVLACAEPHRKWTAKAPNIGAARSRAARTAAPAEPEREYLV